MLLRKMLRPSMRIPPLRRFLRMTPARPLPSQGSNFALVFGIGATVAAVTYMNSDGQRVTLDAHPVAAFKPAPVPSPASAETHSDVPLSTKSTSEDAPLEDDESSGGAFDPATGEINWDCPCLGGMAHGPCGPQFREAFSCFVFSENEPKGIDCVEKFKGMQDCFREHPDIYAEEIMDNDEDESDAPDAPGSPSEVQEDAVPSTKTAQNDLPQAQLS